jgi:hypothetical protein
MLINWRPAKPPENKAKRELRVLRAATNKPALRKLLYGWPTVQLGFRIQGHPMDWPTAPAGIEKPPPLRPPISPEAQAFADDRAAAAAAKQAVLAATAAAASAKEAEQVWERPFLSVGWSLAFGCSSPGGSVLLR